MPTRRHAISISRQRATAKVMPRDRSGAITRQVAERWRGGHSALLRFWSTSHGFKLVARQLITGDLGIGCAAADLLAKAASSSCHQRRRLAAASRRSQTNVRATVAADLSESQW
jgi:hypothetical protein